MIKAGKQNGDSHVCQSGTEVLVDVGFQDGVEVLEFDVANKCDYKNLVRNKRRNKIRAWFKLEEHKTLNPEKLEGCDKHK